MGEDRKPQAITPLDQIQQMAMDVSFEAERFPTEVNALLIVYGHACLGGADLPYAQNKTGHP